MEFAEILVTSDSPNPINNCSVYDLKTCALLESYKVGNSIPKGLALIKNDYLLSALMGKPTLNMWTVSSKKDSKVMTVPGMVSALAVTNCGSYCVAAIGKSIYIWEVATGLLLAIISQHYQDITCLRFTSDGSHFISGGKDALVYVWDLVQQICVYEDEHEKGKPRFAWGHHTAEITDIFVSSLAIYSRVATASLDMTSRIYEFYSGILLFTVCMEVPITSVAMDPSEYFLLLGGINGFIFKVNMFSTVEKELHVKVVEERPDVDGHEGKVNCLSVSQSGLQFVSGSDDKTVKVWDLTTLTCQKSISHEGIITNAFVAPKPLAFLYDDIVPSFKVSVFRRQLASEEQDISSFKIVKKLIPQKLSLMHVDSPEELFNYAILHGSYEERKRMSNLKVSVQELQAINCQMYSHVLHEMYSDMVIPMDSN